MKIKRITRLLQLLETLQAGHGDDADGLARRCGVSRRTLFRDLETLRAAGVPLEFEKNESRYWIAREYFLPPTNFTTDEAVSIVALASQLGADDRLPFFGPARSAALKLQASLSPSVRRQLLAITRSIHFRINALDPLRGYERVYQQLIEAVAARRVVQIVYGSLTECEDIETKLRPYHLVFNRHTWYVIGRSSYHSEPRTFNLGRIKSLKILKQKFVMPRGFSLERYLGNAWNIMPEPGPDHLVEVRFLPLVAKNVSEVSWHKTQQMDVQKDKSLLFRAKVSGLNEIAWWILGYGDQAEVLRPAKLRKLVAHRVNNMRKFYERENDAVEERETGRTAGRPLGT